MRAMSAPPRPAGLSLGHRPGIWLAAAALAILAGGGCVSRPPPQPVRPGGEAPPPALPAERAIRVLHGNAVWYGGKWQGRRTASGERFDKHAMTAAHRSLPLGTRIRVTNLENQQTVILRVNDRGPYGRDRSRVIDVSEDAARRLGFHDRGWVRVKIEVLESRETRRGREAPPGAPVR
jgi:rare lipoprotein A